MAELVGFQDWPWQHWASHQPEAIALWGDKGSLTWKQLSLDIKALAEHFHRQGLRNSQAVVLRGKNSVQFLLCQLAVLRCGSRVLPLNPKLPTALVAELLPHLNINFMIDFEADSPVVVDYRVLNFQIPNANLAQENDFFPEYIEASQKPATMILTSGSTGLPKAAVHTMLAHLDCADGVLQLMDYRQGDCWLLSLPLFHVSGQGILWRWLLRGGGLAIKSAPLIEALQGVTHASLVPTQLWRLLNQANDAKLTLRQVLLGGAMIPTSLTDLAATRGIECWSGYGMTEMASTVCAKQADGKKGGGHPLKGKSVRLVDDEIQIQSLSQAMGYWFDGEIIPLKTLCGWFKTNDKGAYIDGEYQIIGRLDNQFISGGECVQPEDIESVINSHPAVSQSFVVPIDDVEFGQRAVAVLELTDNTLLDVIAVWLKDKLTPYQYPAHFYHLADNLKNCGIKVSRQEVKNWVLQQSSPI